MTTESNFSNKKPFWLNWLKQSFRGIFFFLALFSGATYESASAQIHATPITFDSQVYITAHTPALKISQIQANQANNGSNTSTSSRHPIVRALANLFHVHSSHVTNVASANGTNNVSAQKTSLNTASHLSSATIPSTFLGRHPLLNEISHYISEVVGPYSYKPSAKTESQSAGKTPVILVHGTWANGNWMNDIYHSLDKAGIPTYVNTFGSGGKSLAGLIPFMGGVTSVSQSEKQLSDYIDEVQKETGATKVDLVGHSQGGLLIKDYIAHDTKDNVQAVVDLGATNHGTTRSGLSSLLYFFPKPIEKVLEKGVSLIIGQGATDQLPRSNVITELNQYPDTKAGIHYLVLSSKNDATSTPYENTYLKPVPGADVTNLEIHSLPGVTGIISHSEIPLNPGVINAVTQFIGTKGEPHLQAVTNSGKSSKNSNHRYEISPKSLPPTVSLLG